MFDRAQHCLYGTPTCRFCRQRLTDWQSMRKHLTQGMCPALKTTFASGQTLEQILVEVIAEEAKDPPPPPAAEWKQETPLIQSQHEVLTVPNHQLAAHAKFIKSCAGQCVLCRQRVAGPGNIKTHWRTGHPAAWKRTSAAADSLAGSMSAIFQSPCQFCGSQAKEDSKAHSRKCPSFFQIAATRQPQRRTTHFSSQLLQSRTSPTLSILHMSLQFSKLYKESPLSTAAQVEWAILSHPQPTHSCPCPSQNRMAQSRAFLPLNRCLARSPPTQHLLYLMVLGNVLSG